jgi:hypothetical protein
MADTVHLLTVADSASARLRGTSRYTAISAEGERLLRLVAPSAPQRSIRVAGVQHMSL